MILRHALFAGTAGLALSAAPLSAQETPSDPSGEREAMQEADEGTYEDGTIIVRAERIRGQLDVEQPPIVEYDEGQIGAFGAGSIAELAEAISADSGSSRGRGGGQPVFLVNGIRIASFREFRSYPPEAVRKVEVLPEEVAQRFGFPADRRVVNFILKDNFSSREIELGYEQPGRGGYYNTEQEFTLLQITGGGRLNVNIEREDNSLLTEGERGVLQNTDPTLLVPGDPDPANFRSLVSDATSFEATANYAKAFIDSGSSISLNTTYERNDSISLSGLDSVILTNGGETRLRTFNEKDPLRRRFSSDNIAAAASYNEVLAGFQTTATLDAGYSAATTLIDRRADSTQTDALIANAAAGLIAIDGPISVPGDAGFDTSSTDTVTATGKLTAQGELLSLPAGDLSTTFDFGYDWNRIESDDTRNTLGRPVALVRGDTSGGVSVVVPITSTRREVWDAIGTISLNGQARFRHLSDFGTLLRWNAGITWSPTEKLTITAGYTDAEVPPSLSQLGNPQIISLNVPVFDFTRNETALVQVTSGGNPDLLAEKQTDWNIGANWETPIEDVRLNVNYVRNRSSNVTSSFPTLTQTIEAAFRDRVTRDADGTLLAIDQRPVTFAEVREERMTFGLNMRGRVGKAKEPEGGEGGERGGRGGRGGNPAAMLGRGGGDGRGFFFASLNHTLELDREILIAPGIPILRPLDGDAPGLVQNTTSLEAGLFWGGVGTRLSGNYVGEYNIDGSGLSDSTNLTFGELATIDLRMFFDLGELFDKEEGTLKGLRLSFRADNVFDGRRNVTDQNGVTPIAFQPFLIDPVGRYLGFEVRKLF